MTTKNGYAIFLSKQDKSDEERIAASAKLGEKVIALEKRVEELEGEMRANR